MKLIMFTPTVKTSAIAGMASLVAKELLTQGHEVIIVRTEQETFFNQERYNFDTEIIDWNNIELVDEHISNTDTLIYQIGNAFSLHCGCLQWLPQNPGIICLHDFYLAHLFYEWACTNYLQAKEILRTWYGDKIAELFFNHQCGNTFLENTNQISPMTEWICAMSHGVITHSKSGVNRILNSCPGPVYIAPLPYDLHDTPSNTNSRKDYSRQDSFRILTIGHINPNKRANNVLHAIGKSSMLQKKAVYQLVGKIHPEMKQKLSSLANNYRINLVISEEVDHATLIQAIEQADVISCLRWPALEAASASAIEAMLHGKPTIVTNTGFYSELPDNCVQKIDPENEIDELQSALELLYQNTELRQALGTQAQKWAKKTFTTENYVQKLIELCISSSRAKPAITAANYFVGLIKGWDGSEDIVNLESTLAPLRLFNNI